jgi:hypothetical protein
MNVAIKTLPLGLTPKRGICTILLMAKPECVPEFMNGNKLCALLKPVLRTARRRPIFEKKIEHHSGFSAVQLAAEAFDMRVLIGDCNSDAVA